CTTGFGGNYISKWLDVW
nr:immunoglobulin heavy chain junction region [Macaca mulatta]MOW89405.1 immunoglobulin heavy chain junction region [Macaca mulatta]MOW92057.1 immunoglobulin heavy chain junction region [Macaca mulatta]MOW92070.1 immunoglobulin heavy chain junction region [Macaca mulatta]